MFETTKEMFPLQHDAIKAELRERRISSASMNGKSSGDLSLPPNLRRIGSCTSTYSLMSSFNDGNGAESTVDEKEGPQGWIFVTTLHLLAQGMSSGFCKNGLPWKGPACRSKMAGLSGVLYAIPVIVATGHHYDQIMWTLQAFLSVMADYYYIDRDSFWHGLDRYFAIFNLLTIIGRAYLSLSWQVTALSIFPVACYVGANRAKNQRSLSAWHVWHCLWHVTGGPLAGLVVYMLHHCPDAVAPSLEAWCQHNV